MLKVTLFCFFSFGFLGVSDALAAADSGGWVSSGGELLKDSRNPWFLKNTKQVKYCIDYAADGLSVTREFVEASVLRSLEYWKLEFAELPVETNEIGLGQQEFTLVESCNDAELRLQFGHKTLTAAQLDYIRRPKDFAKDFVGLAVRTSYDPVNLQGRGFIFINSDVGPDRFVPSTAVEGAWSYPYVLDAVLMHELGHIFGLPHIGHAFSLMSEGFPEMMVSNPSAATGGVLEDAPSASPQERFKFFTPLSTFFDCFLFEEEARTWFGLAPFDPDSGKGSCIIIETKGSSLAPTHAEVFEIEFDTLPAPGTSVHVSANQTNKKKIADIIFESTQWVPVDVLKNLHIFIHLTEQQVVFEGSDIMGPPRMTLSNKGTYTPVANPTDRRAIRLRVGALEDFELIGIQNGDIVRLLKFML